MARLDELQRLLRPAGAGLHAVSSGLTARAAFQREYYGRTTDAGVAGAWRTDLGQLRAARVVLLGVPSDTGAGLVRGAAFGPQALRAAWQARRPGLRGWLRARGVIDAGDVRVVPHLLEDGMLSRDQVRTTRRALYGDARRALPVSPLSIAARALGHLRRLAPAARPLVLGGDHSVAWPVAATLPSRELGIVHIDAHTDLLPERQGVRYCFATWAYHALGRLEDPARLVQLGVRASRHGRTYWERTLGVRQYRAEALRARDPVLVGHEVADHLLASGAVRLYLSNDIDGTDGALVPATGTPEPAGLRPAWVRAFIRALGGRLPLAAADLVEVAPPVGGPAGARRTLAIGVDYLEASLDAMLGRP